MSEYIDREVLTDRLNTVGLSPDYIRMQVFPREVVERIIFDCPSADVRENIHGDWIKTIGESGVLSALRCNKCGFEDDSYSHFNFCPNCGADMRGEQND